MPPEAATLSAENIENWRRRIREDTFSNYYFEMARALIAGGEIEAAIDRLRRALNVRPNFPLAAFELQQLLILAQRPNEAEEVEKTARVINYDYPFLGWLAAVTDREDRSEFAAAKALADEGVRLFPGSPALLHWQAYLAHREGAVGATSELPELSDAELRSVLADRYNQLAHAFLEAERFHPAARLLDIACSYTPDDMGLAFRHAVALLCVGRFDDGADLLERVNADPPDPPPDLDLMVRANLAAGRLARATALAEDGMGQPEARSLLGLCLITRGDWAVGEACLRAALAEQPNEPFILTNLGLALQGLNRIDDAIEAHQAALALRKDDPWTLTNLGLALAAQGRTDAAARSHRQAIEAGRPYLLYNLAQRRWAFEGLMRIYNDLGAFEEEEAEA